MLYLYVLASLAYFSVEKQFYHDIITYKSLAIFSIIAILIVIKHSYLFLSFSHYFISENVL